jgi:hypothetical protein
MWLHGIESIHLTQRGLLFQFKVCMPEFSVDWFGNPCKVWLAEIMHQFKSPKELNRDILPESRREELQKRVPAIVNPQKGFEALAEESKAYYIEKLGVPAEEVEDDYSALKKHEKWIIKMLKQYNQHGVKNQ